MNPNPNLWRRIFAGWFPRLCGHIFDAACFLAVTTCIAWLVYFGIMAP